MNTFDHILKKLPYSEPFLFADEILHIDQDGIRGRFTYKPDSEFYKGHFKDNPITPGVILVETMAQIGLVCYGIWLLDRENSRAHMVALAHTDIDFLKAVLPGESVEVISEKVYYRFGKLKCRVRMENQLKQVVCKGTISGMLIDKTK